MPSPSIAIGPTSLRAAGLVLVTGASGNLASAEGSLVRHSSGRIARRLGDQDPRKLMLVKPQSAAPRPELMPTRNPRKANRTGMPLETHFREAAA